VTFLRRRTAAVQWGKPRSIRDDRVSLQLAAQGPGQPFAVLQEGGQDLVKEKEESAAGARPLFETAGYSARNWLRARLGPDEEAGEHGRVYVHLVNATDPAGARNDSSGRARVSNPSMQRILRGGMGGLAMCVPYSAMQRIRRGGMGGLVMCVPYSAMQRIRRMQGGPGVGAPAQGIASAEGPSSSRKGAVPERLRG
jgi:hypothetical protein